MDNPDLFEMNLRHALAHATERVGSVPGIRRLELRQFPPPDGPGHATFRVLPEVDRSMAHVAEPLRETMRGLVAGKKRWPLFLHGPVGTGKTLAALSLADYVAPKSPWIWPAYFTMESLCNEAMAGADSWRKTVGIIRQTTLLIVDEIGEREKVADLYSTTLKQVLDARDQSAGRVGIYISNVSDRDLPDLLDDRLVSRLTCGEVFELKGPDRRKGKP